MNACSNKVDPVRDDRVVFSLRVVRRLTKLGTIELCSHCV